MDPKRQWRRAGNVWHNAMARSLLQTVIPLRRRPTPTTPPSS
jgi:hypothetical protein